LSEDISSFEDLSSLDDNSSTRADKSSSNNRSLPATSAEKRAQLGRLANKAGALALKDRRQINMLFAKLTINKTNKHCIVRLKAEEKQRKAAK
jgi:hypothetical protein